MFSFKRKSKSVSSTPFSEFIRNASSAEKKRVYKRVGTQKHYQADPKSPLFAELCSIAQKTVGLAEPLREALAPLAKRITAAFVYGSVAKRSDTAASDIDLMAVSDSLTYADLYAAVEQATARLGRKVNPTVYSRKELARRVKQKNAFVTRVMAQPRIWLIGAESDLASRYRRSHPG